MENVLFFLTNFDRSFLSENQILSLLGLAPFQLVLMKRPQKTVDSRSKLSIDGYYRLTGGWKPPVLQAGLPVLIGASALRPKSILVFNTWKSCGNQLSFGKGEQFRGCLESGDDSRFISRKWSFLG